MAPFNPRAYGPTVAPLLAKAPLNQVGPGTPMLTERSVLESLTPASVVAPHDVADRDLAAACLAGLWLRFDFLDESHHLSQAIDTPEGSYWHALMHRREPDFANARYWFRRRGDHPIDSRLAEAARRLAGEAKPGPEADFIGQQERWDAVRFVDLCEEALDASPPLYTLVKRIQQAEWELLFDYCYRRAVAE